MALSFSRCSPMFATKRRKSDIIEYIGAIYRIRHQWDDTKLVELEDQTQVRIKDPNNEIQTETTYRFHGRWKDHPKYGRQFAADTFSADAPVTQRGVIKYLSSTCDHVGEQTARRIWNTFGPDSLDVVQNKPEALAEAGILTLDKAKEAAACLKHELGYMKTKVDLIGMFKGYGLGGAAIQDCLQKWGARAAQVIRRDPFKMLVAQIHGAGYNRCDRLYLELGLPPRRLKRQMLKLWSDIKKDYSGHTWFSFSDKTKDINPKAIELALRAKWLVTKEMEGKKWITERNMAQAEAVLARHLTRLAEWKPSVGSQSHVIWPAPVIIQGISDHQREEVTKALAKPVAVLAGSPGTGKTYVAAALIKTVKSLGMRVKVCAPTGKAAVRVKESLLAATGISIDAMTIHKMCGLVGGEKGIRTPRDKPHDGIIIVDETSMVDTPLMATLLSQCEDGTHILFLGDPYQLPPVGHGAPLRDMLRSDLISKGELTEIQRNAGQIVKACKDIKEGKRFEVNDKYNEETGENLRLIETADNQDTVATVLRLLEIVPRYNFDPIWDTQILVAVNERGPCSRVALNQLLQQKLNPDGITIEKHPFRVNDKVICLKNNKVNHAAYRSGDQHDAANYIDKPVPVSTGMEEEAYIANGEIGKVIAVGRNQTIVTFPSPTRTVRILHGTSKEPAAGDGAAEEDEPEKESEALQYALGYAITTHKSQGSDSPCIIVVIDPLGSTICTREHLYTSISRAKKLCILVGQRKVADQFCNRIALNKRKTLLVQLLEGKS